MRVGRFVCCGSCLRPRRASAESAGTECTPSGDDSSFLEKRSTPCNNDGQLSAFAAEEESARHAAAKRAGSESITRHNAACPRNIGRDHAGDDATKRWGPSSNGLCGCRQSSSAQHLACEREYSRQRGTWRATFQRRSAERDI
jgi:hypothetical protein